MDSLLFLNILANLENQKYATYLYGRYGNPPKGVPPPPPPITIHNKLIWVFLFCIIGFFIGVQTNKETITRYFMLASLFSFIFWQYKQYGRSKQKVYETVYNQSLPNQQ
jgi:hypothetical protein